MWNLKNTTSEYKKKNQTHRYKEQTSDYQLVGRGKVGGAV